MLPRSGNALKKGWIIPNSPGLIDEDYKGEWGVILTWLPHPGVTFPVGTTPRLEIKAGDKVAQGLLIPYIEQEWTGVDSLPDPDSDRVGGFGSTDKGEPHVKS